jgi:hypothetical protein
MLEPLAFFEDVNIPALKPYTEANIIEFVLKFILAKKI